jgi:hypothetical protein
VCELDSIYTRAGGVVGVIRSLLFTRDVRLRVLILLVKIFLLLIVTQ